MDESTYLRLLQQDPENEKVRHDYFAWLSDTGDQRAQYVQLMHDRLDLLQKLQQVDGNIRFFQGIKEEWLEIAFPLRIRSETVGRIYLRPTPASPPFVEVGKIVAPDTVVGLVEVMATFNEVAAGVHGVIDEVAVANGDAVEFNQILFRLKRPPDPFGSW